MKNSDLMLFEKYAIEKGKYTFDNSCELIMFVNKLNEYVVKYYSDCLYSYILKRYFKKNKGSNILDYEFEQLVRSNDRKKFILTNNKSIDSNDKYLNYIYNSLLEFVNKIQFIDLKYASAIEMAKEKRLSKIVKYNECIKSAIELKEFQEHNIYRFISYIENEIKDDEFSFLKEIHDFIDRLNNYYLIQNNDEKMEQLKVLKKEIKSLD